MLKPWRESQERQAVLRAHYATKRRITRIVRGKEQFGSASWRSEQEHRLRREIEERMFSDADLAALVAEQERDMRSSRMFGISLDQAVGEDGATLLDFVHGDDETDLAFQAHMASIGHGYTNAWTEAVHRVVDRRREIDSWAEAAA